MLLKRIRPLLLLCCGALCLLTTKGTLGATKKSSSTVPGLEGIKILRNISTQRPPKPRLLYWDQSLADEMGFQTPPGRVGIPEFERAIVDKLAFEIAKDPTYWSKKEDEQLLQPRDSKTGQPRLLIEEDAHGGAGRAGYILVDNAWINVKGIGLTGLGNAKYGNRGQPSPPLETFSGHSDGSAVLEEGIKEAILGRIAHAELKKGGSRVLALIATGRTLKYPDGRKVPETLILRQGLQRFDQASGQTAIRNAKAARSLAQANMSRILKGDFVNPSNLGAHGEFIDYGCMGHTCGYANVISSQDGQFLKEGLDKYFLIGGQDATYRQTLGKHTLSQMGIPEAHIERALKNNPDLAKVFWELGVNFQNMVLQGPKLKLDYAPVDPQDLQGNLPFTELFAKIPSWYFRDPPPSASTFQKEALIWAEKYLSQNSEFYRTSFERWVTYLYLSLEEVRKNLALKKLAPYGNKLQPLAEFRNRPIHELVRPLLFENIAGLARDYEQGAPPSQIQKAIDEIVYHNRTGTSPVSEGLFHITADSKNTYLQIRADQNPQSRQHGLFAFPDKAQAAPDEKLYFRISTDGWKSHQDIEAQLFSSDRGDYYRLTLPHRTTPLSDARLEMAPFIKRAHGGPEFILGGENLKGAPLVLSERAGLPATFSKEPTPFQKQEQKFLRELTQAFKNPCLYRMQKTIE